MQDKLDKMNEVLSDNPERITKVERDIELRNRFLELKEMGVACNGTRYKSDIPTSDMPSEFSSELDKMLSEENVVYGIHRIGSASDKDVLDILENGLVMTGRTSFGVREYGLEYNVGVYLDNLNIKTELLNAHGFKNSNGSILIRIPDENLSKNDFLVEQNDALRLKPKFIVGYVPLVFKADGTVTIDKILSLGDLRFLSTDSDNGFINPDPDLYPNSDYSDNDTLPTGKKPSR